MNIEIFCRVVDNFGDAGVCGRLARQLADEHGYNVRLWIDKPEVLEKLQIDSLPRAGEDVEPCKTGGNGGRALTAPTLPSPSRGRVMVEPWPEPFTAPEDMGDVVIEAFACGTPKEALTHRPLWINLEYLSTESWAADNHLLPSTSPTTGLVQYFYFPGFWPGSGGLLRERDYFARQAAFDPVQWWQDTLGQPYDPDALKVSLFCYNSAPTQKLLEALAAQDRPVQLLLPETLLPDLKAPANGRLSLVRFPFLPQAGYDPLLWSCDLNLVRGEDSFVRANWAGKPLIWQAYPEERDQQKAKISGFLTRYSQKLPPESAQTLALAHEVWNLPGLDAASVWPRLLANLPALGAHARAWAQELAQQKDLVTQLTAFMEQQRNPL